MEEYQYWITYFNVLFLVSVTLLAWNTTFFIKNKVHKVLSFIVFFAIYKILFMNFIFLSDVDISNSQDDKVLVFIYHATHGIIPDTYYLLFISVPAFIFLSYRLLKLNFFKNRLNE